MGMSASQVRLLTITKRIHSVENEAERIQNQKMLLGLQSDEAYEEYLDAMQKKDVQVAQFNGNTGDFEWNNLTLSDLYTTTALDYQLKVRNLTGVTKYMTATVSGVAGTAQPVTLSDWHAEPETDTPPITFKHTAKYNGQTLVAAGELTNNTFTVGTVTFNASGTTATSANPVATQDFTITLPDNTVIGLPGVPQGGLNIISQIEYNGVTYSGVLSAGSITLSGKPDWVECETLPEVVAALGITDNSALTDPTVFRDLIYNAYAIIEAKMYDEDSNDYIWKETSIATNTSLREMTNKEQLAIAEANYEAALRKIDKKEEYYDKELAKFDQERKALTTQLETLKTCIKENIDRTFKIFQG